jgi:hypothetical protein
MKLSELQVSFFDAVRGLDSGILSQISESKKGVSADERIEVYHYAYFQRLEGFLKGEYPKALAQLGEEKFSELAREYYKKHPSKTSNLSNSSRDFPAFLASKQTLAEEYPGLREWAALEWGMNLAYYTDTKFTEISGLPFVLQHPLWFFEVQGDFYVVFQKEEAGVYRKLESYEFQILKGLHEGAPLESLLTEDLDPAQIQGSFSQWVQWGVLRPPQ